ncbi:L,D-transpeptidase family protein [Paracoccus pacificus]|uniref:Murein L,D-transpeptidase family protein n=1 Tax=Paracoccus pacificus TaxID=1463598 RepID=A0ABW4R9U1_9RHOB
MLFVVVLASCGGQPQSKFKTYAGPPVTQVQINKGQRVMMLFSGNQVLKTYRINLGNNPVGDKMFEGDGKTPEGVYFIDRFNPNSQYYLSVGISYPDPQDVAQAEAYGRRPGGDIFIHGQGAEGRAANRPDWTAGCIAITDSEIEDVYSMLRPGVPIIIRP